MKLYLIRHAETVDNVAHRLAGIKDSPLTNHGALQITRLGRYFASQNIKFSHIFSSDLSRAVLTAEGLSAHQPELSPVLLPSLRERDFGSFEGTKWHSTWESSIVPKQPESEASMRQRANAFLNDYLLPLLLAGEEAGDEVVVAVVSHGLLLRSLWRALLACFPPSDVRIVGDADISAFNPFWANTGYLEVLVRPKLSPSVGDSEMPILEFSLRSMDHSSKMESIVTLLLLSPVLAAGSLHARIDNGLAKTPQMGYVTPAEGYRYVTTDCGWSVADRLPNGTLTWNETLFPSGFPAMGEYLHGLGLLFGVYGDAGILLCGSPPDQAGSLNHEQQDAQTFADWGADSLKYDNCYSDAATGYPNVNYEPSTSPQSRYEIMSNALLHVGRPILFQICEWGVDFPALWAPELGNSWRIGNDIIPAWRSIFRTLNQAVPNTPFAGPGQWPDLDMLFVGNGVFSLPEEQTHFSLWAILKSPLTIGAALKDDKTSINPASLEVLKQKDVIGYNQDALGVSANLKRRWSDEGYEVWSGPLSGNRTVVALINWQNVSRDLTLDLPDAGLQYAQVVKNIWGKSVARDVRTSYTANVAGHGTMLLELQGTVPSGSYPAKIFAKSKGQTTTFESIYGVTTSANYTLAITFVRPSTETVTITTSSGQTVSTSGKPTRIALTAGSNTITIRHKTPIESIQVTPPTGTYYANTVFNVTGSAQHTTCGSGCSPVGSKIGYLSPDSNAYTSIPVITPGSKYLEIDYINNDVAFSSSWGWGSNSRNLTVSVNDGAPVRLEVPLSGRHSELFSPGKGWWDSATLGVLTSGWKTGENKVVFGNEGGEDGFQTYAADFVDNNELASIQLEASPPPPGNVFPAIERWNHPKSNIYKTLATFWCFLVMGANDAAYGPLIPYLEQHYSLTYTIVSLVFLSPLGGYILAALTNNHIHLRLGRRGVAIIAPSCHILSYIINCLHPPYPLLVVSFVFAGFGTGLADSGWNAWVGNMADANQVLGLLHGFYGAGAVLAPLVATALVTKIGCAAIELATSVYCFWDDTGAVFRRDTQQHSTPGGGGGGGSGLRKALFTKRAGRITWVCSVFLLLYVGVEVALGGWIVTFMMRVRHGEPFASGMAATGFWLGITVGRVVLGFVTPRIGEKLAITIYLVSSIAFGLILWLVPNFYVSSVAVSIQGFFLGPLFPAVVVVATKLLPRGLHVSAIGFASAFGAGGGSVLPFAVGAIAQAKGVKVLQPFAIGLLGAILGLWMGLPKIPAEHET
ncbi:hypothetical protein CFD26_103627 [Aspergillus turcosus]|uniref:Alpha-galactosidase n=1 Tax=Aspergillus turcosus TaxID=1245748 RepID=A0A3R7FNB4_9EURO|nr:hypothetical protein CFD26_103627 [Aspergillus turcosus]